MSDNTTGPATDTGAQTTENTTQTPAPGAVPYQRFQEVVEQRKGLETTLNSLIDGMVQELPEDVRDLVPNLPPAEKAAWIRAAKARGIFTQAQAPAGSLDTKRPGGKPPQDFSGMTPAQMIQSGYGQ